MEALFGDSANPLHLLAAMAALSLLPFLMLAFTSFVKLSVVFSILRNALGAGQVPSGAVSTLLSLTLSIHIMAPVLESARGAYENAPPPKRGANEFEASELFRKLPLVAVPFLDFLRRHTRLEERAFFAELRRNRNSTGRQETVSRTCETGLTIEQCLETEETVLTLVPAFVISELRVAFAFGFLLFLPFLIIDLIVANILMGLGMVMVNPVSISLPFKLLLFVACDGWMLLCRSLVLSYA
ncbi:MAG: EscR/YscR/HrcR family type III secretion system export apparatus protein [Bdellovibrionales bacterium]|nr:EscR/YscR/HrcR family type III secretion system export apparatus protein [Bdellovibrionales bacterium]